MTENHELTHTSSDIHNYHNLRESLVAGKTELLLTFIIIAGFFYFSILGIQSMLMVILGFIAGIWLAFRPSE